MSRIKCPACGAVSSVDAARAGTKVRCLRCGGMIVVPADAGAAAPAERAAASPAARPRARDTKQTSSPQAAQAAAPSSAQPPRAAVERPGRKGWVTRKALVAGGAVLAAVIAVALVLALKPGGSAHHAKAKPRTRPVRPAAVAPAPKPAAISQTGPAPQTLVPALAATPAATQPGQASAPLSRAPASQPTSAPALAGGAVTAAFQDISQWHKQGRHADALQALVKFRNTIGDPLKVLRWRLEMPGDTKRILVGTSRLYLLLDKPLLPDRRDPVQCSPKPSGIMFHLHCGDPDRGRAVWSRKIAGLERLFVDPAGDDLYVCGEGKGAKMIRIRAFDGEVDLEREIGAGSYVGGIANGGRYEILDAHGLLRQGSAATVRVFDIPSGDFKQVTRAQAAGLAKPLQIEAQDIRTPEVSARIITGKYGGATEPTWTYRHAGPSHNLPLVREGDVFLLEGMPETASEVVRLEGATGSVKWRFRMPRGAGRGLDLTNGRVTAVGGDGAAIVLDAATGALVATIGLPASLMAAAPAPLVVGRHMLTADPMAISCYSLDAAAHDAAAQRGAGVGDSQIALLEARCLAASGQEDEALRALEIALERSPDFVEGWAFAAQVAAKRGYTGDGIGALVRVMESTGVTEAPAMRKYFGLLKRLPTAGITARPAMVGGRLYFGARDGACWVVDPATLEVVESKRLDAGILSMTREGTRLTAYCADGVNRTVYEFAQKIDQGVEAERSEPALDKLPSGDKIPRSWFTRTEYDGYAVGYKGKYYRPLGGGQVRVLDMQQLDRVETHNPLVSGIEMWKIAVLPSGPVGYNQTGIFELNENLAPVRKLTDFGPKTRYHGSEALVSDGRTIAVVRWSGLEEPKSPDGRVYLLEVRTPDGQELIQSRRVAIAEAASPGRFVPLAGGYLLSSHEMMWVPGSADGPVWHFEIEEPRSYGRPRAPGRRLPRPRYDGLAPHAPDFTTPLIANGRLFVGHVHGGIYVFDLAKVTGGAAKESPAPSVIAPVPVAINPGPVGSTPGARGPQDPASAGDPGAEVVRKSLVALPHKLEDVAVGGGGRYLVLQFNKAKQAAVFDAVQRKIVYMLDAPSEDFTCAAGLTKFILVDRTEGVMQRYDLASGKREQVAPLPAVGAKYEAAVMGEASEGPLLLVTEQFPTGPVHRRNVMVNPRTLGTLSVNIRRPLATVADPSNPTVGRAHRDRRPAPGEPIDPDNFWAKRPLSLTASPDGTVFAGPTNAHFGTGGGDGYGALFFDGSNLEARVLGDRDTESRPGLIHAREGRLRLALRDAEAGPEVLGVTAFPSSVQQLFLCYHPGEHSSAADVGPRYTLWSLPDRKRLLELPRFEELQRLEGFSVSRSVPSEPYPRPDPLNGAKRMRLIPEADSIVILHPSNDRLVLRPFDLVEELDRAGAQYLYVDSPPPPAATKGRAYSYQLTAKSKAGGAAFALRGNAPQGLTLSPAGELKWSVPTNFASYLATFTVTVKDKSGKMAEHVCTIPVQ